MSTTSTEAGVSQWWRLVRKLTVVQASLLALGRDPQTESHRVEMLAPDYQPMGYSALKLSILHAVFDADIPGELIEWDGSTHVFDWILDATVCNPARSHVEQGPLFAWLKSKGCSTGLLVPDDGKVLGISDKSHPRYAPKLAAAIAAWESFDEVATNGGSVKQKLQAWLYEHAGEYSVPGKNDGLSVNAIEEISTIANWDTEGGAPKKKGA